MIDFCYFSHAATMYFHLYDYGNVKLYMTIFMFSNGPILIAISIWRNSLVFHSWNKVQSVFIHLWPASLASKEGNSAANVNTMSEAETDLGEDPALMLALRASLKEERVRQENQASLASKEGNSDVLIIERPLVSFFRLCFSLPSCV